MSGWQNKPFRLSLKEGEKIALCMCGNSKNGPYCDGSHKGSGLAPKIIIPEQNEDIFVCGCRTSSNIPYCDGSHKKLNRD